MDPREPNIEEKLSPSHIREWSKTRRTEWTARTGSAPVAPIPFRETSSNQHHSDEDDYEENNHRREEPVVPQSLYSYVTSSSFHGRAVSEGRITADAVTFGHWDAESKAAVEEKELERKSPPSTERIIDSQWTSEGEFCTPISDSRVRGDRGQRRRLENESGGPFQQPPSPDFTRSQKNHLRNALDQSSAFAKQCVDCGIDTKLHAVGFHPDRVRLVLRQLTHATLQPRWESVVQTDLDTAMFSAMVAVMETIVDEHVNVSADASQFQRDVAGTTSERMDHPSFPWPLFDMAEFEFGARNCNEVQFDRVVAVVCFPSLPTSHAPQVESFVRNLILKFLKIVRVDVPVDCITGKTKGVLFIELETLKQARHVRRFLDGLQWTRYYPMLRARMFRDFDSRSCGAVESLQDGNNLFDRNEKNSLPKSIDRSLLIKKSYQPSRLFRTGPFLESISPLNYPSGCPPVPSFRELQDHNDNPSAFNDDLDLNQSGSSDLQEQICLQYEDLDTLDEYSEEDTSLESVDDTSSEGEILQEESIEHSSMMEQIYKMLRDKNAALKHQVGKSERKVATLEEENQRLRYHLDAFESESENIMFVNSELQKRLSSYRKREKETINTLDAISHLKLRLRREEKRSTLMQEKARRAEEKLTKLRIRFQHLSGYGLEHVQLNELRQLEGVLEQSLGRIRTAKEEKLLKERLDPHQEPDERKLCVVCLSAEKSVLCLPCRHLCVCDACSKHENLDKCPMCRVTIAEKLYVFS